MLNVGRCLALVLACVACSSSLLIAQRPKSFDVASVRQSTDQEPSSSLFPLGAGDAYRATGGRFRATNVSLLTYIAFAYKLTSSEQNQVELQGPEWVWQGWDIEAKSDGTNITKDDMREMMRSLLAERFRLKVHTESRSGRILALELQHPGRTGPQLKEHDVAAPCSAADSTGGGSIPGRAEDGGALPVSCGGVAEHLRASKPGYRRAGGRNISMALLTSSLTNMGELGVPVVDRTGLNGKYDFILEWVPRATTDGAAAQNDADVSGPGFEDALADQLGLKLVHQTGSFDYMVLDHVERPTPN